MQVQKTWVPRFGKWVEVSERNKNPLLGGKKGIVVIPGETISSIWIPGHSHAAPISNHLLEPIGEPDRQD